MKPKPKIFDSEGRLVPLGTRIGGGGEGTVWEVRDGRGLAAKLYHKASGSSAKVQAMVRLQTEALRKVAAWPVDTLHTAPGGEVAGLLMPKASGFKQIHLLYGPKSRLSEFPRANWTFLLRAAANLARAFATIHEHGHVVGDVNHGNILISEQALVRLIDCDSFQVSSNGHRFLCGVGVSTHTPPELQGGSLRVVRTESHDAFGLAVLIFQLLFLGRHPFSGQYLGPGEMPLEKAIREHRFAYGRRAALANMRQPPHTPDLAAASPGVALLFERAFSVEGSRQGNRPAAREWITTLEAVEIRTCERTAAHTYAASLAACPWCDLEGRSGTLLFNISFFYTAPDPEGFDRAAVWAQIQAVPAPPPPPPVPSPASFQLTPSPFAAQGRDKRLRYQFAAWTVGVLGIAFSAAVVPETGCSGLIFVVLAIVVASAIASGVDRVRKQARNAVKEAQERLTILEDLWYSEASLEPFQAKREALARLRRQLQGLPAFRQRELARLEADLRKAQLQKFLDRFRIDRASIAAIGASRKATLQSYGIETAGDLTARRLHQVPGFGPALTDKLLSWRRGLERRFVFDPSQGIDPAEIAKLDRTIAARKAEIERSLQQGPGELRQVAHQITLRRQALYPQLEAAVQALAQARVDLKAV